MTAKEYLKSNIIYLLIAFSVLLLAGCSEEKKQEENTIGKYVYIDSQYVVHLRSKCRSGLRITDESGETYYKSVNYVETKDISNADLESVCPFCVNDELFEKLQSIADRNEEYDPWDLYKE